MGVSFSAPVQTGPEDHPASCTMDTVSFPGVMCGRGVTLTPHHLLVPRSNIELSKKLKIKIYKNIILFVFLYGCETWSLTLREERRLRVFENRVLRIVFGPKRDEVTGEWRKLHNEELSDL